MPTSPHPRVRPARPDDVPELHTLIRELAAYERASDQVHVQPEQLSAALFGEQPTAYAQVAGTGDGEVAGFALYFLNFSTWEGLPGIYLEDLYVRPEHRGSGLGKALLRSLAATAVERGYVRFEWAVLNWNTPSIDFYRSLGAEPMNEWTTWRVTGDTLHRLAGSSGDDPLGDELRQASA